MAFWIDTHCHLDAGNFSADVAAVRARAASENVALCVIPAVEVTAFEAVRTLAHRFGDAYALGIHPMYVQWALHDALARLDQALTAHTDDPRLVAVGEIGLDYFVPELTEEPLRQRQEHFFREQLKLARRHGLPVILHVRRSVDQVLKGLREIGVPRAQGGVDPGLLLTIASLEWQRPVWIDGRRSDWETALFVDAGAVANHSRALSPQVGIGVGLRYRSPVGPLQVDLAYGIERQALRLHMSVGFAF